MSLGLGMNGDINHYRRYLAGQSLAATTITERVKFARRRWLEWQTWDVPSDTIGQWLSAYTGWTKRTYFNHLRSLFGFLHRSGVVLVDPMAPIRRPPAPRPNPRPLTEDQLRRALAAADRRVWSYLLLGYLAGLRAFEIGKFHGQDISPAGIYVVGKGGQAHTVPTHPLLWDLAQSYPRDAYWFPSPAAGRDHVGGPAVSQRVGKLFAELGIPGATHRARHTYGTQLLRGGANLRIVQDLMRHASLATTALYLGVDEDERRSAINGLAA